MNDPIATADARHPSLRQLRLATLAAILAAGTLTVTAILPAEYGIDPLGVGDTLGLTEMGRLKQSTSASPRQGWRLSLIGSAHAQSTPASRSDEVKVILKPGDTAEVKAFMKVGDEINWSWTTVGGKLNYEFHGEPLNAPSNVFTSYGKGSADKAEGAFKPKFAGTHGWFWRNRTSQTITVTVSTKGNYEKLERVK